METRRGQAPGTSRSSTYAVRVTWPQGTKRHVAAAVGVDTASRSAARTLRGSLGDRLFAKVFSNLVYAQIWEDPVADLNALGLSQSDRLVTIASGGCNVMSYLTAKPAQIVAVDLNAHHLALLRLRLAAVAHLPDHLAFMRLIGHADEQANLALYRDCLRPWLDARDRHYWGAATRLRPGRAGMLSRGLTRHGVLGRFIGLTHAVARLHGVRLAELAEQPDLEAQRRFYETRIDPIFDSALFRLLAARPTTLFGLGIPPAQARLLAAGPEGSLVAVLRGRVRRLACEHRLQENYFAMQAFTRSYRGCDPDHLPPYLQERHYETVRGAAARVTLVHDSVTEVLAREPSASLDAYVLLDAQDWMTESQRSALWRQITRTAKPGARVLFRTAGIDASVPAGAVDRWRYDEAASVRALREDRSAIYGGCHLFRLVARR